MKKRYIFFVIILLLNLPLILFNLALGRVFSYNLVFIVDLTYVLYFVRKVENTSKADSELTKNEKLQVIVTLILGGVLVPGAAYYYCWKGRFPKKANEANKYSFIVFGALFLVAILLNLTGIYKFF